MTMVDRGREAGKNEFLPFDAFLRSGAPEIEGRRESRELPADFVPDQW